MKIIKCILLNKKLAFLFFIIGVSFNSEKSYGEVEEIIAEPMAITSDDIITIFGQKRDYPNYEEKTYDWESNIEINTNLDCGKIQFATNIDETISQLSKIPEQLVQNAMSLIEASPFLLLCTTDPVLCAELKNLDLKINTSIDLQTEQCQAINNYIDNKSERGKTEAYSRAIQDCVTKRSGGNAGNYLEAMNYCQQNIGPNDALVTDIVKKKINTNMRSPQKIIESSLKSVNEYFTDMDQERYALINLMFGEMELKVNGEIVPLFPESRIILKPKDVKTVLLATASRVSCSVDELQRTVGQEEARRSTESTEAIKYLENTIYDVFHRSFTNVDVRNLSDHHPMDFEVMCYNLAKSVALEAYKYLKSDVGNSMIAVSNNDFIPDDVRKQYSAKNAQFFLALESQIIEEEVYPISILRQKIGEIGKQSRLENRIMGETMSRDYIGSKSFDQLKDECDSVYTCS